MINEETEAWRKYRQDKANKRLKNLEYSTNLLKEKGIQFESHNFGKQLVILCAESKIDFYPSTGLWIERTTRYKNRGIRSLLAHINDKKE